MEACGYTVIRIWESDMTSRRDHVRQRLLAACKQTADYPIARSTFFILCLISAT